jgi:hypothetical protein
LLVRIWEIRYHGSSATGARTYGVNYTGTTGNTSSIVTISFTELVFRNSSTLVASPIE